MRVRAYINVVEAIEARRHEAWPFIVEVIVRRHKEVVAHPAAAAVFQRPSAF
ncbi:hypothetical protein ACFPME_07985 [Rhodanobacter umsongensis]|uniref:Uncharacterized protein n=1 Tax=Rhodanobacter umsongensis TaxID=633153 RepID=A0ABW0JKS2_9GAMM